MKDVMWRSSDVEVPATEFRLSLAAAVHGDVVGRTTLRPRVLYASEHRVEPERHPQALRRKPVPALNGDAGEAKAEFHEVRGLWPEIVALRLLSAQTPEG